MDAQKFVAEFDPANPYEGNPTILETETKAYLLTHLVFLGAQQKFKRACSSCTLGLGINQEAKLNQAINNIVNEKGGPYDGKLADRVFARWVKPEGGN